uniref:Uncharacterized protein n=1 Tax=Tetranychus urticae TaxID=32264 RepID=T1KL80_TETUR
MCGSTVVTGEKFARKIWIPEVENVSPSIQKNGELRCHGCFKYQQHMKLSLSHRYVSLM